MRADHDNEVWPGIGRFVRLPMYPMTVRERVGDATAKTLIDRVADGDPLTVPADPPDLRGYVDLCLESGLPTAAPLLWGRPRRMWLASYLQDLLTHGVQELDEPTVRSRDTDRPRRYFEAHALNSVGVTEHKTIFDAADVTRFTATAYEDLLTRLLILDQVRLVLQPPQTAGAHPQALRDRRCADRRHVTSSMPRR